MAQKRSLVFTLRRIVVIVLATAFTLAGLVGGGAGVSLGLRTGNTDDLVAGLFMGGCFLAIGIMLFVVARKMARQQAADVDLNTAMGVTMAHMMNMDDVD